MFPTVNDPHSKLKLALTLSLQLSYYFGMVIIIFTSAAFIPDEINSKRIYTIFPKPVSRIQYLLGKLLGICFISFSLLFVFALTVIIFVRISYNALPEESQKEGRSFFRTINSYSMDSLKRFRNENLVGEIPAHSFEVSYKNFDIENCEGKISLKILATYTRHDHDRFILFDIDFIDGLTQMSFGKMKNVKILDKKFEVIVLPADLPLIGKKNLVIKLKLTEQTRAYVGGVSIKENDFHFQRKSEMFEFNILKAFFIFAVQFILLGFIAVAASTRMSYYISAIFSVTTFAAGSLSGFFKEYIREKSFKIDSKVIDVNSMSYKVGHLMDQYMQGICNLMPNFSKYDISADVINGISINGPRILEVVAHYGIFIGIYLFLASVLIWKREV
jgi:hypothetical protein